MSFGLKWGETRNRQQECKKARISQSGKSDSILPNNQRVRKGEKEKKILKHRTTETRLTKPMGRSTVIPQGSLADTPSKKRGTPESIPPYVCLS